MKKFVVIGLLIAAIYGTIGGSKVTAQDTTTGGRVRITQMVYSNANVLIDGETVITDLGYPFTSDYLSLPAGAHTISVIPVDVDGATETSTEITITDQHRYTVATIGELDKDTPTLLVIDETAELGTGDASSYVIMIHSVADAPAVDVFFNDQQIGGTMSFGTAIVGAVPAGKIASRADLAETGLTVFTSDYFIMPDSVSQASLAGSFASITSSYQSFSYERFSLRVSDEGLIDFLTGYTSIEGNNLNTFFSLIEEAGLVDLLSEAGPFTVFAPTDAAFAALPAGTLDALRADPQALADILRYHIVPDYLPAFRLVGEQTLTTLHGGTLQSSVAPGTSAVLNGSVHIGLENRVSNGVLYPVDTVILTTE